MKRQEPIARIAAAEAQPTETLSAVEGQTIKNVKPIQLTEEAYAHLADDYGGFCIACGDEAYGVEPDARRYQCESCGARAVFGAEELLLSGAIQFTDDKNQE